MRFNIIEEVRANGKIGYWVGQASHDMDGDPYFDQYHRFFTTFESAKDYIEEQTVISRKEVYKV